MFEFYNYPEEDSEFAYEKVYQDVDIIGYIIIDKKYNKAIHVTKYGGKTLFEAIDEGKFKLLQAR